MRLLRTCMRGTVLLACAFAFWLPSNESVSAQEGMPLRGVVLFPTGAPAAGATVNAITACDGPGYRLVSQATTADGTFSIAPFGEDCRRYRFTANKRSDFWLETGEDVFYGGQNGTSPTIDLSSAPAPNPIIVRLGQQGGRVVFRVWDTATNQFIYAELGIEHQPIEHKRLGSMETATGKDGSANRLLLPSGEYVASVITYRCRDKQYWSATQPLFPFNVVARETTERKIVIDVRQIASVKTYANPSGNKCRP